ncbi:MAG TPA: response regulator transcription factor [Candidatus Sulfotelmatobacter sp.]|nr:response regulator transcription factor [Candidatus Sulfotelmatobacter sp.]HWI58197.1 response regulator transcription factor [Bacillota bacterium]
MSIATSHRDHSHLRPLRVSIIEDDAVVREHLVGQLNAAPGFLCASSHPSAESALEEILRQKPDVVLTDINLPGMSGIDCVRHLKQLLPTTHFVMLTVYEDADFIFKSLLAGAVGYLLKGRTGSGDGVLEAVRDAAGGGAPLNSLIARKIVQYFHRQVPSAAEEQPLSAREREVLELLSSGLLYKEIAARLGVNIETVRKHCHNIYEKLHVNSRTEAAAKWWGKPRLDS